MRGFLPCMLLTYLILMLLLLFPFTPTQISIWPMTALIALLIVGTFFGCGKTFRGRPQFQSPYHGEHTIVMDEIGTDMLEQDAKERMKAKTLDKPNQEEGSNKHASSM